MRILAFLLLTLSLSACKTKQSSQTESEISEITYGTHFGHCRGICRRELHFTKTESWFVTAGNDLKANPETISPREWDKSYWNKLTDQFPKTAFTKEDEVIGCPDCADGGKEYIAITTTKGTYKVTFEFTSEQKQLEPVLARLRALMEKEVQE